MGAKYERVIKRDGSVVEFNKQLIINAITMAFKQNSKTVNTDLIEKIATQIENLDVKVLSVEEIQDIVVKTYGFYRKRYCYGLSKL